MHVCVENIDEYVSNQGGSYRVGPVVHNKYVIQIIVNGVQRYLYRLYSNIQYALEDTLNKALINGSSFKTYISIHNNL